MTPLRDETESTACTVRRFLVLGLALFGSNATYIVGVKLAGATAGSIWQSAQPLEAKAQPAVALRTPPTRPFRMNPE